MPELLYLAGGSVLGLLLGVGICFFRDRARRARGESLHAHALAQADEIIAQARKDAGRAGIRNARFLAGDWRDAIGGNGRFDLVLGIFFFHHLTDEELAAAPRELAAALTPGGSVYGLEPSARRLAGYVGKLVVPNLMKRYQTADERQLLAETTEALFRQAGYNAATSWFDFASTPLAGLLPSWGAGNSVCRW